MSDFKRRPFSMGNTGNPVHSQPEIRGSASKDSDGEFPSLPLPSELVVETEDPATSGGISTQFSSAQTMAYVLTQLNAALSGYATAYEYEGCLVIQTVGTGDGAYVRILQPIAGFDDASAVFGYPVHPNPTATVRSGDHLDAPVRPSQQNNPVGTKYVATGEDRTGTAYNRALQIQGQNLDTIYTWLKKPIPTLVEVEVDSSTWSSYIAYNADGTVDQVNLAGVAALNPSLSGRFFLGSSLSRNSTLDDIAEFWGVLDTDHNEIPAGDRTVRIGCVTRGQRGVSKPTFSDDTTAPSSPLLNTSGTSVDGRNALGVDRTKSSSVQITEVRQNTVIVCSGATFITDGVVEGDVATIAGATVDVPFNHSGTWLVETVVTEEVLILRPHHENDSVRSLNPSTGGDFGTVTISSGGDWEQELWVTFEPPLPRFPENGKIKLILPMETTIADLPVAALAAGDIRTSEEVDGWVLYNLWKQLSYSGVYQGQGLANGGGYRGRITHRPITFVSEREGGYTSGTSNRTSTATATLDAETRRLSAGSTDSFTISDVGKTILINGGPLLSNEPWTIVRYIDRATVELAPPLFRTGYEDTGTVSISSWEILDDDVMDLPSMVRLISPEYFGQGDDPAAHPGIVYIREQRDQLSSDEPVPGMMSFLHLEKVKLLTSGTNVTVFTSTSISGNTVEVGFDPEDSSHIFADVGDTKTYVFQGSITYLRILHGDNAGLYRIYKTNSVSGSGTNSFELKTLSGATPTFASETLINCCLYNVVFAVGVPGLGGPDDIGHVRVGGSFFADAHEAGIAAAYALRLGWRGTGGGLFIVANDAELRAYDGGDGSDGPAITILGYVPADGIEVQLEAGDSGADARRKTFGFRVRTASYLHDYNLNNPGPGGPIFSSNSGAGFSGYIAQAGKDPALVVVKHDERSGAGQESLAYSRLTASAAVVIARARSLGTEEAVGPTGRGSALETAGSIWVYRRVHPGASNSGFAGGGIFSEDVVGAGRFLYPIVGAYDGWTDAYGTGAGWEGHTQLGHPGQVFPVSGAAAAILPSGDLGEPDYDRFNFDHSGIMVGLSSLNEPYNRVIGCRLKIMESGHALENEEYAIVGVVADDAGEVVLCLSGGTTVGAGDAATVLYKVLGMRWHQSHLDIGDWMQVGTYDVTKDRPEIPLITVDYEGLSSRVDGLPTDTVVGRPPYGMSSYAPWAGAVDGISIGIENEDTTALSNVYVAYGSYPSAWSGDFESLYYTHGWGTDFQEPRPPFYAETTAPASGKTLNSRDFTFNGTASYKWSSRWGGCILVYGSATETAGVWQRGRRFVMTAHLAVNVHLRMSGATEGGGPTNVTLELLKGSTVLTSSVVSLTHTGKPEDLKATLSLDGVTDGAVDAMADSRQDDRVSVRASWTLGSNSDSFSILDFRVEQATAPKVVSGPQITNGTMLAHGYRYTDMVRGFQTRGPADAKLLGGLDYARNESWPTYDNGSDGWADSYATGTQEIRGNPGLVRMTNEAAWYKWNLTYTATIGAVTGDINTWMNTIKSALQYAYDESSAGARDGYVPGSMTDEVADAVSEIDAAIAESDPALKLELAEVAVNSASDIADTAGEKGSAYATNDFGTTAQKFFDWEDEIDDAISMNGQGGYDPAEMAAVVALLDNKPEREWVRPWVDYYRLFSQGVHSATITLYNGAFDPLWYAAHADRIDNDRGETNEDLDTSGFVPPGMTGFLIPLDPPHGSILASLDVGVSIRPHDANRWGIWRDVPDDYKQLGRDGETPRSYNEIAGSSTWSALAGYVIELWRHNALDFGVEEPQLASWSDYLPQFGFAERIGQWTVDLSGISPPSQASNTVEGVWRMSRFLVEARHEDVYIGRESYRKSNIDLIASLDDGDPRLRVDRRHYSYMLVVKFYGGMRYGTVYDQPFVRGDSGSWSTDNFDSRWEIPQGIRRQKNLNYGGELAQGTIYGHFDTGYYPDLDADEGSHGEWADSKAAPPQVKFRGARLGWLTDRGGDGGWGS